MNIKSPQKAHKKIKTLVICPHCRKKWTYLGRTDRAKRVLCHDCQLSPKTLDYEIYTIGNGRRSSHQSES